MKELELFSLDGLGGWFRRTKAHPFVLTPGQKCLNCDTELQGRYCHVCGQDADTHHRTIGHLIFEAFEGLFHLDGRLWRTLPPLFFKPGELARDLMEGRVTRHVPPFRIFLVTLLIFMFVAEHKSEEMRHSGASWMPLTSTEGGTVFATRADGTVDPAKLPPNAHLVKVHHPDGTVTEDVNIQINIFAMSAGDARYLAGMVKNSHMQPKWLKDDLYNALNNPERFFASLFSWGHRLALLLLPIIGVSLGVLYAGKKNRRYFLYDHLLVAMNLLAFVFLTSAIGLTLPDIIMMPWGKIVIALWTVVNFYLTLRGGYGSSVMGAIFKSIVLWAMTGISFLILLLAVMFVSLTAG